MSYTLLYYIKDNFSSLFVRKCVIYNQKTWRFVRNTVPLQAKSKTNDMKRIKNATFGENYPCHSAGRHLRQFIQ